MEEFDFISKFEYGGSLYENLKIIYFDVDDVVIFFVLNVKNSFIDFEVNDVGYVGIKVIEDFFYKEFFNLDGFFVFVKF